MSTISYNVNGYGKHRHQEISVHIEVLRSYINHCCVKSSHGVTNASEISCYVLLIAKLLENDQFVFKSDVGATFHALFETAIEMNLFNNMFTMLLQFDGDHLESLKESHLQFYDILMSSSCCGLFLKEEFLIPMTRTLNLCSRHSSLRIEHILLQCLHATCVALHLHICPPTFNNSKLEAESSKLFWSICLNPFGFVQKNDLYSTDDSVSTVAEKCSPGGVQSICDLLVNYVSRDGNLCWLSRDSLLLLMASSTSNECAGYHMANNSNLCEVLVTDMVLLFNNIPRRLVSTNSADEWPSLVAELEQQLLKNHPLHKFLDHYEFCCSILDLSNNIMKENMLDCFYKGFILPVLAPEIQSSSEPEVATATVYLDRLLWKSKGSILLPFLLRFLFSERIAFHSDGLTPQTFRHNVTQALDQSFPLFESSFYRATNAVHNGAHTKTYMDVLLKRIQYGDTLVGIATLSLINTIVDLLCEDVVFELLLKYILPLGTQPTLNKAVTNPFFFFASADRYLALIPTYYFLLNNRTCERSSNLDENLRYNSQHGNSSSLQADEEVQIQSEVGMKTCATSPHCQSRMRLYLQEARKLIAERKAACGDWRFTYDIGSPSLSAALNAHMNENPLVPLPQEGLLASENEKFEGEINRNAAKVSSTGDRSQWELDGFNQVLCEEDCILASLERFSALLREPSRTAYKPESASLCKTASRRRCNHEASPDPDDVKRTSSLYNITFVELDPDEVTEVGVPRSSAGVHEQMSHSVMVRQPSTSSASSLTSRSMELSLTESSEQLPAGVEEVVRGGVPALIQYLDKIPGNGCNDGKLVDARFADYMHRFNPQKGQEEKNNARSSINSAVVETSIAAGSSSSVATPLYFGPFFSSLLQLISLIPTNHLYANLQVTRLITHLLALPLPLVRLQLLPLLAHETAGFDGQSLYTTLLAVRQWFDCFINLHFSSDLGAAPHSRVSFPSLIDALREAVFQPPEPPVVKPQRVGASTIKSPRHMFSFISRLRLNSSPSTSASSLAKSSVAARGEALEDWRTQAMKRLGKIVGASGSNSGPLEAVKDSKFRGILVALFVFEEFCRELASLCLEHSVTL